MYRVFRSKFHATGGKEKGWEKIGEHVNYDEAYKIALTVCEDVAHEPRYGAKMYWFSDVSSPDEGYKVVIDGDNFFRD